MSSEKQDDTGSPSAAAGHAHGQAHGIVGRSRAILDVIRRIETVAATRSTVLITGETGTGKELDIADEAREPAASRP